MARTPPLQQVRVPVVEAEIRVIKAAENSSGEAVAASHRQPAASCITHEAIDKPDTRETTPKPTWNFATVRRKGRRGERRLMASLCESCISEMSYSLPATVSQSYSSYSMRRTIERYTIECNAIKK